MIQWSIDANGRPRTVQGKLRGGLGQLASAALPAGYPPGGHWGVERAISKPGSDGLLWPLRESARAGLWLWPAVSEDMITTRILT